MLSLALLSQAHCTGVSLETSALTIQNVFLGEKECGFLPSPPSFQGQGTERGVQLTGQASGQKVVHSVENANEFY